MQKNALILLSLVFWFYSCEAPRDNPLDPEADNYTVLNGSVQTYSVPYTPLKDVSVYWANSESAVKTDSSGRFQIANAAKNNGYIQFVKQGYRNDSLFVQWGEENSKSVQMSLNKLPVMSSSSIRSAVINLSDDTRTYEVHFAAKIEDEDKDVDSVIVRNSRMGLNRTLDYDIINKNYRLSLTSDEFILNDIEEIIGEQFRFYVSDIFNNFDYVGAGQVTRVIRNGATAISPADTTTTTQPTLKWTSFQPGYELTYTVDVYRSDPTNPQLVFRSVDLPMTDTSVKINVTLTAGNYFWVIYTIDSFNNSSRSKPAYFTVR